MKSAGGRILPYAVATIALGAALFALVRSIGSVVPVEHFFSSDNVYLTAVYRDVFRDHLSVTGWKLTPAPYFFPDMPVWFVLNRIFGPDLIAVNTANLFVQTGILVFVSVLLARSTLPIWILTAAAFTVAVGEGNRPLLVVFLPTHHTGTLINSILCMVILRSILSGDWTRETIARGVTLCVLVFLATASDRLFLAVFAFPACISIALSESRRSARVLAAVSIIAAAALAGPALIMAQRAGWFHLPAFSPAADIAKSIIAPGAAKEWIRGFFGFFFHLPKVIFGCALLVIHGLISTAQMRRRAEPFATEPLVTTWLFLGTLCAIFAAFAITQAIGAEMADAHRYLGASWFFLPLAMPLVVKWQMVLADRFVIKGMKFISPTLAAALVIFAATRTPLSYQPSPLAACLDAHREELGEGFGFSDYWNSRLTTMASTKGIRMIQLKPNLEPYFWINNKADFRADAPVSFVILTGLDRSLVETHWGKPVRSFRCTDHEVWVYASSKDTPIRQHLRNFPIDSL